MSQTQSHSKGASAVVDVTEKYYDSDDADQFYLNIWGGEDIHIGLYEDGDAVFEASRRTVERMASKLAIGRDTKVLDLGAGYGGSARYLAALHGCEVTCLNLSQTQNTRNRTLSKEQGLESLIEVVHGNFESVPLPDNSCDVVWSQDAFLHSGNRRRVLEEAKRVLRPGGELVFTDPMQADGCPPGVLKPVLDRIHLETLASPGFYRTEGTALGLEQLGYDDLTPHLVKHYTTVRGQLELRYDEITKVSSKAYVDRMISGLGHCVDAGEKGYLAWGILHFRHP